MSEKYTYTTAEQLLRALANGDVILRELCSRSWLLIDPALLTEDLLYAVDREGETIAYQLAHTAAVCSLPQAWLTPRLLMTRGRHRGQTVLAAIIERGRFMNYDWDAWFCGAVAPLLTRDMLLTDDTHGHTVLHELAKKGFLGVTHLLTGDMLAAADISESMIAVAARCSGIDRVGGLLTSELLMLKTMDNRTVLCEAVRANCLDRLPPGAFLPAWMKRKFKGRPLAQILVAEYPDYVSSHLGEFHEKVRAALLARLLAN